MMNTYYKSWLLAIISIVFVSFSTITFSQNTASSNPYNLPENIWTSYKNKTAAMLEKANPESFFNYIIMMSDGNMADMPYFKGYVRNFWRDDYNKMAYEVGTGKITSIENIKLYLASLQPTYTEHFKYFQKHREQIIEEHLKIFVPASNNNTNPSPQNCGSPCTNPGFESGNSFWDYWAGDPNTAADPANLTSGFNPPPPGFFGLHQNQHFITTAGGFDPTVGGSILPVVPPGGGNNALQLGDIQSWGSTSWGAARASISFVVSAANANFTYRYAIVLQDPNDQSHDDVNGFTQRPYFRVKLRDQSGNILTCGDYEVVADGSKPDFSSIFTETSQGSNTWYRNWTTVFVPLQSYVGQCVSIEFTTSDCTQGGHMGYGYVDCACEPLSIITSSPNICGGNSVSLTAPAGGATYAWTDSLGNTSAFVGRTDTAVAVVNQPGTYKVVVTSVAGPTCQTILYITIGTGSGNPIALFTSDTVCEGSPTHFMDASLPTGSAISWKWDFNNDGTSDDTTQNPSHVFATVGTYPVKLTISAGACGADTTLNVNVIAGVTPTLTPVGPFCNSSAPITLSASITGGTWSGSGITNAATGAFDPASAAVGNDTIIYTLNGSCATSVYEVIVINTPPIADAGPDAAICTGGVTFIGSVNNNAYSYVWAAGSGLSSNTISNPTVTLTNSGNTSITNTYKVTVTETSTGCLASDSVQVTVYALPTANAGSTQTVCKGGTFTLAGSIGGTATSGYWSGGTGTYYPDSTALNAVYTPSNAEYAADSVLLTLTTNDPTGPCNASSSNVTMRFFENPIVNFGGDSPTGCPIHCINFTDSSSIGGGGAIQSWTWDFGDGSNGAIIPNPSHCFDQSGFYDIKLIVSSSDGCISSLIKTQMVHVFDVPIAEFNPSPNPATILDPSITFNNQSSSDVTYWHWDFGDSITLAPNTTSPVHIYPENITNTYMVTLIVHNSDNCYDTVAHPVTVGPAFTFYIPNAFTPNGDGVNDYFYGSAIGVIKFDLWIFDRWGNRIFHGKDLSDKWDGKANDGSQMAEIDVYIWKVELTDIFNKDHSYVGTVTIVK